MGVYLCRASRIHIVFDFFDVCLGLDGFKRLRKGVSSLMSNPEGFAQRYKLHFSCASISIQIDDLLELSGILDEAMDSVVLLGLEEELKDHASVEQMGLYQLGAN